MNTTMTNPTQAEEWKISKRGRSCSVCQREFRSEEVLYSGIAEIEGVFQRRDVCVPCWDKKPELFSFWKTQMPKREVKRLEDINAMQEFFKKLLEKPRLVVANKMDLPEAAAHLAKFKRRYRSGDVLEISCITGAGLEKLKKELLKRVTKFRGAEKATRASAA